MIKLRKSDAVRSEEEARALLAAQDDFISTPEPGKTPPQLPPVLLGIWGSSEEWEWSDETQPEYDQRIASEKAEADELAKLKTDNDYFKDAKIRPWRDQKMVEWIDDTFAKPLKYNLTGDQIIERAALHVELCDWPDLFTEYKTDDEIDELRPASPSWIAG